MEYHAGMIAYQSGDVESAKQYLDNALSLNPHFSMLYADGARQLLTALNAGEHPKIDK